MISIAMTCYNNGLYVREALESILNQEYEDWQIVFVDDCSTDRSVKIFKSFVNEHGIESKIKLIVNSKNIGYGFSLATAIEESDGDLIAILDSDDFLYTPKNLNQAVEFHRKNPDVSLSYSNFLIKKGNMLYKPTKRDQIPSHRTYLSERSFRTGKIYYVHHLKVIKKSFYDKTQGINKTLLKNVDRDLILKMEEVGRLKYIDEYMCVYRKHKRSLNYRINNVESSHIVKYLKETKKKINTDAKERRRGTDLEKKEIKRKIRKRKYFKLIRQNKIKKIEHENQNELETPLQKTKELHILSYPKCGRTWVRFFLGKYIFDLYKIPIDYNYILNIGKHPVVRDHIFVRTSHGYKMFDIKRTGQVMKPGALVFDESFSGKKTLFLYRSVKDIIVSHYFQCTLRERIKSYKFKGSITSFIKNKKFSPIKICEYLKCWHENKHKCSEYLEVSYEEMRKDSYSTFKRIIEFSGLHLDEEILLRTIEWCEFEKMKKMEENQTINHGAFRDYVKDKEGMKVRRGVVGGYADYLSKDDIEYIDAVVKSYKDEGILIIP